MNARPSGPGTAFANFLIEELGTLDRTNQEIATALGYARPNIVSAWKTASTKFTLDNIWQLSEMLEIDPSYLMALYIDQYVSANDGVDHFREIVNMLSRLTTDDEWPIILAVRGARKFNSVPMTDDQREGLEKLFAEPPSTPEGPYKPLDTIEHLKVGAARRKFARRGQPRDMSVEEIERARKEPN